MPSCRNDIQKDGKNKYIPTKSNNRAPRSPDIRAASEDRVAKADIAEELKLPVEEIEQLIFVLSVTGVATNGRIAIPTQARGVLRRVK